MSRLTTVLIPPAQRQTVSAVRETLDLGSGHALAKRSGFLIMLVLSGIIATAGVLADSTATVIGAMIIAPLGTPILGIALGLVIGRLSLVLRSLMWVGIGLGIVVVLGMVLALVIPDPESLRTNSQVVGRTSPQLLDLLAAIATGTAGAFAMCRRDLSAVLPGVAISISLVPPLGVVGVCVGQGAWAEAFGALFLFLSNMVALVIAGSVVFTLCGYARDEESSPTVDRRRAYTVVATLALLIAVPLAVNSVVSIALARWAIDIRAAATVWLTDEEGVRVDDVRWNGAIATIDVTDLDGTLPPTDDLARSLAGLPDFVRVVVDVGVGGEVPVR